MSDEAFPLKNNIGDSGVTLQRFGMTGRGANGKKAATIKRLNPDNIPESLELILQTEGFPGAVALITNKKIFCIAQLLDWKT